MSSDQPIGLLEYLYQVTPQRKSKTDISKAVSSINSRVAIDEELPHLLREGYIFQWKDYPEDNMPPSAEEEYGITIKGILFHDNFKANSLKEIAVPAAQSQPMAIPKSIETIAPNEDEPASVEKVSFGRIFPVIILIVFAIAIVWIITHFKK